MKKLQEGNEILFLVLQLLSHFPRCSGLRLEGEIGLVYVEKCEGEPLRMSWKFRVEFTVNESTGDDLVLGND